jgi:hypothetical protein
MSYQNFVYLSEELRRKKTIELKWGESNVSFQLDGKNDTWKVQSSISSDPRVLHDMLVLKELGVQKNTCIQVDQRENKTLLFVKEFEKTNRYTLFRQFMKKYLDEAKHWRLALDLESEE